MSRMGLPLITFVSGLIVGGALVAGAVEGPLTQSQEPGVTGIGGMFFKADNPAELRAWYERHLGIDTGQPGVNFFWRREDEPSSLGFTVWSVFSRESDYFGPGEQDFMINYRVNELDALLERLEEQGVSRIGSVEEYWYGRFAWIADGEGNRVELWEPVDFSREEFERRSREASDR
jgi:predicted enzyme related to lactoylglutathione lyase